MRKIPYRLPAVFFKLEPNGDLVLTSRTGFKDKYEKPGSDLELPATLVVPNDEERLDFLLKRGGKLPVVRRAEIATAKPSPKKGK